jgi:hypothetical protein
MRGRTQPASTEHGIDRRGAEGTHEPGALPELPAVVSPCCRTQVTVSIGGSGLPDRNATNAQDLILVAGAAMYTSKETGRDRCVVA